MSLRQQPVRRRLVVTVLTAGFVVFWIGAGMASWWSLDYQQPDLAATLRSIGTDPEFRWVFTNSLMGAGVLITAAGFVLWSRHQIDQGGSVGANTLGATCYLAGAVLWLASVTIRLTVTMYAVAEPLPAYPAFDRLAQGLLATHLFLSHATAILLGYGLLRSQSGSRPVGLIAIGFGAFLGIGLMIGPGVLRVMMSPALPHLFTALLLGFLLVRQRRSRATAA